MHIICSLTQAHMVYILYSKTILWTFYKVAKVSIVNSRNAKVIEACTVDSPSLQCNSPYTPSTSSSLPACPSHIPLLSPMWVSSKYSLPFYQKASLTHDSYMALDDIMSQFCVALSYLPSVLSGQTQFCRERDACSLQCGQWFLCKCIALVCSLDTLQKAQSNNKYFSKYMPCIIAYNL